MNRWHELSDGSWMCLLWDVYRDEYEMKTWRIAFVYDKRPVKRSFANPQKAMNFIDNLKGD